MSASKGWLRADSYRLGEEAVKSGFAEVAEAECALHIGARFMAHGFSPAELDRAVLNAYRERTYGPRL